jgi:hypothetical protein
MNGAYFSEGSSSLHFDEPVSNSSKFSTYIGILNTENVLKKLCDVD